MYATISMVLRITYFLNERSQSKTIWFHSYKNKCKLIRSDRSGSVIVCVRCGEREGAGGRDFKGAWGNFDDYRYVHYLDFGDDFIGVYTRQNSSVMYFKYMPFTVFRYASIKLLKTFWISRVVLDSYN